MNNLDLKKEAKKQISKSIKKVVIASLGFSHKSHYFNIQMTIADVIERGINFDKQENYTPKDMLTLYVGAVDNVIEGIRAYYPFIDLTGIDANWKLKQIIDATVDIYFNLPIFTLADVTQKKKGKKK